MAIQGASRSIRGAGRTLHEARKQIASARLRRGFWPPGSGPPATGNYGAKGGGKKGGKSKSYGKSYGKSSEKFTGSSPTCFRCGGDHWPSQCPDKGDPKTDNAPPKCGAAFCLG